jgi:hypothetical protein
MNCYKYPTLRVLNIRLEHGFEGSDENEMDYENGGTMW